jgi:hypothetical protein
MAIFVIRAVKHSDTAAGGWANFFLTFCGTSPLAYQSQGSKRISGHDQHNIMKKSALVVIENSCSPLW